MVGSLEVARKQYDDLGFDTLPVRSGGKNPYARAWQKRLPYRLWQNVPQGMNIGIRGGGLADVAFIDCDESRSFEAVTNYLSGLGFRGDSYPIVQTASGEGRHIYITLAGMLSGEACNLSNEIGKGEFRYGAGAMVVAPPSVLKDGSHYKLISGDFSIRPTLGVKDILPLLGNRKIVDESKPALSRKARAILHGKKELIDDYSSRSEAEEALLASLVNIDLPFSEVLKLFNNYPCAGKYAELKAKNPKNAERWLMNSYTEAEKWTKQNESKARKFTKSVIEWAENKAWEGRTGAVDQLIYLAHASIAYKAGRLNYAAACRDLADMAGVGRSTASRSTWRLCKSGLLVPDKSAIADNANTYQLANLDKVGHSLRTPIVRKCPTLSDHDAFRYRGLGKSAGQIYAVLQECPASMEELAELTGRHIKTIKRNLERMAKLTNKLTGEFLPMVASDDCKIYHLLPINLDRIAHAVNTAGKGTIQRKEHAKERRLHRRSLDSGRQSGKDSSPTSGDMEKV